MCIFVAKSQEEVEEESGDHDDGACVGTSGDEMGAMDDDDQDVLDDEEACQCQSCRQQALHGVALV
jgi:hypothetical protein